MSGAYTHYPCARTPEQVGQQIAVILQRVVQAKDDPPTASLNIPATERYPWHASPWSSLTQRLELLPHALLLYGQPGLGMRAFALRLARTLLCAHPVVEAEACGRCQGCLLLTAGNHPDIAVVEPLEDKSSIAIDQIRELGSFLSLRPHTASRKVVVIAPAEAMTLSAANSLLKMLEEPPLGSVIILMHASYPARLPATIRSRCTRVLFKPPSEPDALGWLQTRPEMKDQPASLLGRAAGGRRVAADRCQEVLLDEAPCTTCAWKAASIGVSVGAGERQFMRISRGDELDGALLRVEDDALLREQVAVVSSGWASSQALRRAKSGGRDQRLHVLEVLRQPMPATEVMLAIAPPSRDARQQRLGQVPQADEVHEHRVEVRERRAGRPAQLKSASTCAGSFATAASIDSRSRGRTARPA